MVCLILYLIEVSKQNKTDYYYNPNLADSQFSFSLMVPGINRLLFFSFSLSLYLEKANFVTFTRILAYIYLMY